MRRHKRLVISLSSILLLLLIAAAGGFYYIRSGRLNTFIAGQIKTALADYGIRTEIGGFDLAFGIRTANLRDVKFYNQQTGQLIASVDHAQVVVEIPNPFAISLRREIIFKTLNLNNLQVYADIDANGKTSWQGLHSPPPSGPSRITFDFSTLVGSIDGGDIHVNDGPEQIAGELKDLKATARPVPGAVADIQFAASSGALSYKGRATDIQGLDVNGRVGDAGAEVQQFKLRSGLGEINLAGKLDDWTSLRYNFNLQATAVLNEATRVFLPDNPVGGTAAFNGTGQGQGAKFQISGGGKSESLRASGATVRGAAIDGLVVASDGKQITFSSKSIRANDAAVQGATLVGVNAGGLRGQLVNGRTTIEVPEVTVSAVEASGDKVNSIKLQGVRASIDKGKYQVTGNLSIAGAVAGNIAVGAAGGKLDAHNGEVALNDFQAAVFGGSATGNALLSTSGGTSKITADFNQLNTANLLKASGSSEAPVAGTVGGHAAISWPGSNFEAFSGTLTAQLAAQTTQTKNAIPITGDVAVTANTGNFQVDNLALSTGPTHITATGSLSRSGESNLQFTVTSTKAEELQTIAYSIDDIEKNLSSVQPKLAGDFSFQGHVTGKLTDPAIEGDLKAGSVGLRDQTLGSLSGHLVFSPTDVAFQNSTLAATDGGSAKFSYSAPRSEISTAGRLDATVNGIDIDTILAAAGVTPKDSTISGKVNAEAHITNLPESPTGTAVVNLINGNVFGQPAKSATLNVELDGKTATIQKADLTLAQGHITATGSLNLKTNEFQVKGSADNVDLAKLAESFGLTQETTTGTLNATFSASGKTDDIGGLNINLNAQGQNVMINGRDAGVLTLTAKTNPGGRVDVNLVTGFVGKPQTITASIELQQPGRPIQVSSDFAQLDLGPILTDFAPSVASDLKATISGSLRITGPLFNSQDQFSTDALRGSLTLSAISTKYQQHDIQIRTPLVVSLAGSEVTLSQTHIGGEGLDLNLGGKIGLSGDAGMGFSLTGTADLDQISHLGPEVNLGGKVTINARMEGTFAEPRLSGDITASNLAFSGFDLPVQISNGNGRVVLAGDKLNIENFTALANDGNLTVNGSATLVKLSPTDYNFTLSAKNVDVYYLGAEVLVNTDLSLRGPSNNLVLGGTVNIPSGEYATNFNLNNLTAGGGGSLSFGGGEGGGGGFLSDAKLAIRIRAPGTLLVRNDQINTVGTAELNVGGTLGDPNITGRVALEGGTIKFQTGRYDIDTGNLDFPGGNASPEVNLLAQGDISGYHVTVGLQGPINDMEVTLRSDPELQRSEILSLIATGKVDTGGTINSEGVVESGVGTVGSLLSESFFSKPAQSLLGLNRFALDPVLQPNSNPAARLTVGKQLTRAFSFTYSTNLSSEQDQTLLADYTITNRFSALLSYTQGGTVINGANTDTALSFEIRMRKRFSLGFGQTAFGNPGPPPVVSHAALVKPIISIDNAPNVKISKAKRKELLPVESEGFNRALAKLSERNLENYLQEQGYFRATVKERCDPADCSGNPPHLVYDVKLGNRYKLNDIKVEGTDVIGYSDVSGELDSKKASFIGGVPGLRDLPLIGGLARGITSHDRLLHDRDAIRGHLVNMGYRSAHVTYGFEHGQKPEDLAIAFKVDVGPRSTISAITFKGNSAVTSDELRQDVSVKDGAPFSPEKLKDGVAAIKNSYNNEGYLESTVRYTITDVSTNVVSVEYQIDEGSQAQVAEIDVEGYTKTHEDSIVRFFAFKKGDVLTQSKMRATQRALFATGAFSEVNIRNEQIQQDDPRARRVTVQVTELNPLLLVYGPGYSTDKGVEGLAQLTNSNFMGRANTASIRLRISQREQLGQIQYTDLRPFGSQWAITLSAFYDRNTNLHTVVQRNLVGGGTTSANSGPAFGIDRLAAYIQTERKLTPKASIHFRYNFESVKLLNPQNIPVEEIARNEQSIRLGSLSAGFTWDQRDSGVNPTRGQLLSVEHSVAATQFGGSVSFNKFFLNYQRYKMLDESTPVLKDTILAFAARVGLAAPFHIVSSIPGQPPSLADMELPISERFFAGGATTLRGFGYEEAGPQAILEPRNSSELPTLVPIGGDALMVYNFELRYPLTRQLRLVPFYDLGNVFARIQDINWKGMTHSIGMGIRFNTPLGPVGVDYGYLLNPPSFVSAGGIVLRQPHGAFHFRFGQTF